MYILIVNLIYSRFITSKFHGLNISHIYRGITEKTIKFRNIKSNAVYFNTNLKLLEQSKYCYDFFFQFTLINICSRNMLEMFHFFFFPFKSGVQK